MKKLHVNTENTDTDTDYISNPLFSILIANYNNGQYIHETLESIYKQTYTNWEIIIVDDSSTDNSHEIYETLANNTKIKIYYNTKNEGAGFTKRKCVELAEGDICGFVDPDDTITVDALAVMVDGHLKHKDAALVHSRYFICDEQLNIVSKTSHQRETSPYDSYFLNLEHSIGHFSSFKKNLYSKTEGISPVYKRAVDQDLYLKLYEVGNCLFIDHHLYYYRIHKGGISTNENTERANFWQWMAIMDACKRRNVNAEDLFNQHFVRRTYYDNLNRKYLFVKKYEKINSFFSSMKNIVKRK